MAICLITGGAGFIGSNLARALLEQGHGVRIFDNGTSGSKDNLKEIWHDISFIEGDVKDLDALQKACSGVTYVFHKAALVSVPLSILRPIDSNYDNINGTLNALIAARDNGVSRFILASSSAIYGNGKEADKSEDLPTSLLSPYALTKYTGELYCKLFSDLYGLETISLRYFNVFGPKQNPKSQYAAVIPSFITKMLKGERPIIYGDGKQSRDFTYISNIIEANMLALTAQDASGDVFNIACGKSISLNQVVDFINDALGTAMVPVYESAKLGDIKHSSADIAKAEERLGYSPATSFKDGLSDTINWYKKYS